MTAQEIKIKMIERGIKQSDLCRKWRRGSGLVSMVVNRKIRSAPLERKLARELGVKVSDLRGDQNGRMR